MDMTEKQLLRELRRRLAVERPLVERADNRKPRTIAAAQRAVTRTNEIYRALEKIAPRHEAHDPPRTFGAQARKTR